MPNLPRGRRFARAFFGATLVAFLTIVGGVVFAAPASATGVPVVIDDFSGGVLGTRTVTPTGQANFSQANGAATITAASPGNTTATETLNYAQSSPVDLTSGGSNKQFFLEFNDIERLPTDNTGAIAAAISITLTDSAGKTGTFGTGVSSTGGAFNIVLNFACDVNTVCFSGAVDFTRIMNVQVMIGQEGNYDTHTLTASLNTIRTTPLGGGVPSPPMPTVTTASTSISGLSNTVVHFGIAYTVDGAATNEQGLTASDIQVTGTAGGIGSVSLTGTNTYDVAVGPLTSSGTVTVHVLAGAVTDGWGQAADPSSADPVVTFTKDVVPTVTSGGSATAAVGTPFTFQSTATGVPAPSFTLASGTIPAGIILASNGKLSGTPSIGSGGLYSPVITATNSVGSDSKVLSLTVNEAPGVSSAATATFSEIVNGTFAVTTTGYPTPALTLAAGSVLPGGISFLDNGDGTATLAGRPAIGSNGTYPLTVTASNGVSPNGTQNLSLVVTSAPVITTSAENTTAAPGGTVVFTAAASGTPAPTVQWQRSDDTGAFTDIAGATSTTYSFTAAQGDDGHQYRAVFTNSVSSVSTTASLTVRLAPSFTSQAATTFVVGSLGTFTVTTDAFPAAGITYDSIPSWLTVTDLGGGVVTVSGTPPVSAAGTTVDVGLTASNLVTTDANQTLVITIDQAPVITTNPSGSTVVPGTLVTLDSGADGFPAPTVVWEQSTDGGSSYTTIPGAVSSTFSFVAALADSGDLYRAVFTNTLSSATTTAATVRVGTAPVITSSASTTFDSGVASHFTITTNDAPIATITSDVLPSWLTLIDNHDGTATLAGTAPANAAGTTTFTVYANNSFDPSDSQSFTLTVDTAPTLTSVAQETLDVGIPSTFAVTTGAGFPVMTSITETGTLPDGVTLVDGMDGTATLAGAPTAGSGGDYPFTITATAGAGTGLASTQSFDLVVRESPAFTSAGTVTFEKDDSSTFTVITSHAFPDSTAVSISGALPPGVTFVPGANGTAVLSGTPTVAGDYPLVFTASNRAPIQVQQGFTLVVSTSPSLTGNLDSAFTVGVTHAVPITSIAGTPTTTTISVDGALPAGITLTDNGDGTASFGGIAAPGTAGSYPVVFHASNGVSPATSVNATVTVTNANPVPLPFTVPRAGGALAGVTPGSHPGDQLTITGSGFAAGSPIQIGIYTTLIPLGTATADASGNFTAVIVLPAGLVGNHTIVASGITSTGSALFVESKITITAVAVPADPSTGLAFTGVASTVSTWYAGLLLLGAGVVLLVFAVRRRVSARVPR